MEANALTVRELLPERKLKERSELLGIVWIKKMKLTACDVSAMLADSREACKCLRKLGMLSKTIATHRLKELRHLRAIEKLVTWRRSNMFDRCELRDGQWIHGPLPPTPKEKIASMWADVNALKKAILDVRKSKIEAEGREFLERA